MKEYIADFFTYFGCDVQQQNAVLRIDLTPEFSEYFRNPKLRLVFHPDHLENAAELVTHGSYLSGRIYDLLKKRGEYISVLLPQKEEAITAPLLEGANCTLTRQRARSLRRTEIYVLFRITYYSDEKVEEIVTTGIDIEGHISVSSGFPYTATLLQAASPCRLPFTQKQANVLYEQCLQRVNQYAEHQAALIQEKLAQHFHENITRLEAYYQQMIEEVPILEKQRDVYIRQLQDEYEIKASDERQKCQIQVSITPISFCAVTIPFRRSRYTFQGAESRKQRAENRKQKTESRKQKAESREPGSEVIVEVHQNLFSGKIILPHCESCEHEMSEVGICEGKSHPVCPNCLVECHECGKSVCRDCGMTICFECGEWVCPECSQQCHLCGERLCTRHLLGCLLCRDHFCQQCTATCESCGKPVGRIHLTACEISYQLNCPACTMMCSCCRKHVSKSLITSCAYCGQQACTECTFRCSVCNEEFCVHHIAECAITKEMVCPRHLGTCSQCKQHISTSHLHRCDSCGKTVCTQCAHQCAHCGTYFCQTHTDETIPCSECGTLYCVLCYSGQGPCRKCPEKEEKLRS
jgi:hypothetical protein